VRERISEPIRVLHFISGLGTGGAETMLLKLLGGWDRSRFEGAVVSLAGPGDLGRDIVDMRIPLTCLELKRLPPRLDRVWRLRRWMREFSPSICQGWMYHGNLAATLMTSWARSSAAAVWNVRASLDLEADKAATVRAIRLGARWSNRPARIVYNSEVSAAQHAAIGYSAERATVIPNGFDLSRFRPDPDARARLLASLGLEDDAVIVGHVARYHPMKDHATLLAAMSMVWAAAPSAHLVLVGSGLDGRNEALRELIEGCGGVDRVSCLGSRRDVERLHPAFDLLVMSSARMEGFPNAVGEAMACGVPCVVTDVGDCATLVGDTGAVVPPSDPAALATAVLKLIGLGKAGRTAMGARATRRVAETYSLDRIVLLYQDLYAQLSQLHGRSNRGSARRVPHGN